jgi:hypothetical protein
VAGQPYTQQPIRFDGATLQAEIGYDWFSQARDAWGAIH